ncbi:DUF2795 domain-containing protein [Methanobacterium oryzae]|uniref:DUF2795 domain-containing protein n=1 Tax=Methanobacterium oryzae TaxID=69540 RepID=UPI003D1D8EEF
MVQGGLPPAQIGPFIKDINFPANKKEVIEHAQNRNANHEVIDTLKSLPNQKFNSSQELKRILGDIQRQF